MSTLKIVASQNNLPVKKSANQTLTRGKYRLYSKNINFKIQVTFPKKIIKMNPIVHLTKLEVPYYSTPDYKVHKRLKLKWQRHIIRHFNPWNVPTSNTVFPLL